MLKIIGLFTNTLVRGYLQIHNHHLYIAWK